MKKMEDVKIKIAFMNIKEENYATHHKLEDNCVTTHLIIKKIQRFRIKNELIRLVSYWTGLY